MKNCTAGYVLEAKTEFNKYIYKRVSRPIRKLRQEKKNKRYRDTETIKTVHGCL